MPRRRLVGRAGPSTRGEPCRAAPTVGRASWPLEILTGKMQTKLVSLEFVLKMVVTMFIDGTILVVGAKKLHDVKIAFVGGQRERCRPTSHLGHRRIDYGKRIVDADRRTNAARGEGSGRLHRTAFADDASAIRTACSCCPGRVVRRRTRTRLMRFGYVTEGVAP